MISHGRKSADVVVTFDYSKDLNGTFEINMVKEGGKWKRKKLL